MGYLIDGKWTDEDPPETGAGGEFKRIDSAFRDRVTADGSSGFKAEAGRYHLYVGYHCPWAHRTLIFRALKKLEQAISVSYCLPWFRENGWTYEARPDYPDCTADELNGFHYLYEAYAAADPHYTGKVTIPALWDKQTGRIVNNESSEIIVMLDGAFNEWAAHPEVDLYPAELRTEIDAINEWVYSGLNNGVYRVGFASSQEAYDDAVGPLFDTLDRMDALLAERRYLAGSQHTLADWRAFPTLMRFDLVYHGLFRANRRRLIDYENLWPYLRDLYQTPRVAATVDFDHFIRGYNLNLPQLNPAGIIAIGPDLDFWEPHGREKVGG